MEPKKAERIDALAKAYFRSHQSIVTDKNGEPLQNAAGDTITAYARPVTVTGLCRALGFSSIEEMEAVRDRESAKRIHAALLTIEEFAEEKLFSKESFTGAKLFLSVNFARYGDRAREPEESEEPFPPEYESWAN